jgi:hypothetical protein
MMKSVLRYGAVAALLLVSASAYADDPTGVLLQERGMAPRSPASVAPFSDVGPCPAGTQSHAFPNAQGFRCMPSRM